LGIEGVKTFPNTEKGVGRLHSYLSNFEVKIVIVEACHYEKLAHYLLAEFGLAVHVANPRRARDFANAYGAHGKSDPVDALMLAKYGEAFALAPTPVPSMDQRHLNVLLKRRSELVDNRAPQGHFLRAHARKTGPIKHLKWNILT